MAYPHHLLYFAGGVAGAVQLDYLLQVHLFSRSGQVAHPQASFRYKTYFLYCFCPLSPDAATIIFFSGPAGFCRPKLVCSAGPNRENLSSQSPARKHPPQKTASILPYKALLFCKTTNWSRKKIKPLKKAVFQQAGRCALQTSNITRIIACPAPCPEAKYLAGAKLPYKGPLMGKTTNRSCQSLLCLKNPFSSAALIISMCLPPAFQRA